MDSATTTSVETPTAAFLRRKEETETPPEKSHAVSNPNEDRQKTFLRKYRHVAAVHYKARPSTLSHDTQASPSFVGFRNLMVIVLGMVICLLSVRVCCVWLIHVSCGKLTTCYRKHAKGKLFLQLKQFEDVVLICRAVWQPHLPDMPRFPTERCIVRLAPIRLSSLPSLHRTSSRARCCETSTDLASSVCLQRWFDQSDGGSAG